jgi:acyl-coenzyme A thioesterase PaaI-like protein
MDRASPPTPFDPAAAGWERHPDEGFIDYVGPLWMRGRGPTLVFGFLAQPKHENRRKVVQGGMLMTFADRALGVASYQASGKRGVTASFDCQFLAPVAIGEFVELPCEVVRVTRSMVFGRGVLAVGDRPVASASGVWKITA